TANEKLHGKTWWNLKLVSPATIVQIIEVIVDKVLPRSIDDRSLDLPTRQI
ncbi:17314_t:CDS:1, partial [Cetraspora pellucida]